MQYLRSAILRHVRLGHSIGLNKFTIGGRVLYGASRHKCMSTHDATPENVKACVLELLKKFDKIDATKVTETADFQKDLCLDSLDRVELVMAFEQEFSVEISDDKADKLTCCADVVKYILSETEQNKAQSS